MLRKFILSASAMALAATALPGAALAQDHAEHAAAAAATGNGPAMWRIGDEDTTIYLFGTVHALPEGMDWLKPEIAEALASSDQFVSEIDTSLLPEFDPTSGQAPPPEVMEFAQMQMQLAQLTTGETLRAMMSDEDRAEYEAAMQTLGLPAATFDGFEPWFAMMNISQVAMMQAGIDPGQGVERTLDKMIEGKDRAAFETIEQQLGFFDGLPMESQMTFLDERVEMLPELREGFDEMVAEWIEGDPDGLAEVINEAFADPVLRDTLLTQRNSAWAAWLDDRLDQPGTVFVAVGAGHLGGENSVQDFLAERGIDAERVDY